MSVSISRDSIVDEVMQRHPDSVAVFIRNRMHCPGCVMARFMTLADAAQSHGILLDGLMAELEAALAGNGEIAR